MTRGLDSGLFTLLVNHYTAAKTRKRTDFEALYEGILVTAPLRFPGYVIIKQQQIISSFSHQTCAPKGVLSTPYSQSRNTLDK